MADRAPLLQCLDLCKAFGALAVADRIDLAVEADEIHAVIGPNGAGKSSLVGLLCGQLQPDAGTIRFDGREITGLSETDRPHRGLVRSFQVTSVFQDFTALQNVALAVQLQAGHSFSFLRPARGDRRLTEPAAALLDRVGLAAAAGLPAHALSHGQQRQLEIAMALALRPRLLVLDEPLAGMGAEESQAMIALLQAMRGQVGMLLIEHDMDAVFALADRISVLVAGRIIASGPPATIRSDAAVQEAYLGGEALGRDIPATATEAP